MNPPGVGLLYSFRSLNTRRYFLPSEEYSISKMWISEIQLAEGSFLLLRGHFRARDNLII